MAERTPVEVRSGVPQEGQPIDDAERARREGQLAALLDIVRPAVQADGGDIELLAADVEEGTVQVRLTGACGSCAVSALTLEAGLARILTERLPWVREVTGGVDDSLSYEESAKLARGGWVAKAPSAG